MDYEASSTAARADLKLFYLASPYSAPDPEVMRERWEKAAEFVAVQTTFVLKPEFRGTLFSTIVHYHPLAVRHQLPKDAAFWWETNCNFMRRCDELWVLKLPAWQLSIGIAREIGFMTALGKPIRYFDNHFQLIAR